MSISAGFTADEIREFVLEYQALPQGRKGPPRLRISRDRDPP